MAWSALALRCLLIVAFCLEGGASLWNASAMAARMAEQASGDATGAVAHHDTRPRQVFAATCEDKGRLQAPDVEHDGCDCDADRGCQCPCTFAVKLIAHEVPFAAQQRLAAQPSLPRRQALPLAKPSAVFRPPIA